MGYTEQPMDLSIGSLKRGYVSAKDRGDSVVTPTLTLNAPVQAPAERSSFGRLAGLDVARFIAFVGMVFVNYRIAIASHPENTPNWLRWFLTRIDGRAAAMFIILAGIGVSLMSRKARLSGDPAQIREVRNKLLKRAAFLFVAGLAFYNLWPADILHYYGVFLAVAALLLVAPAKRIWWIVAGLAVVGGAVTYLASGAVGIIDAGAHDVANQDAPFWTALRATDFWTVKGFFRDLLIDGDHCVFPWMAFFLFGMLLGRLDLREPRVRRRLLFGGAIVAVACQLLVSFLWHIDTPEWLWGFEAAMGTKPYMPGPIFLLAASATACLGIAIGLEIAARWDGAKWAGALAVTGQTALSLYLGHILLVLVPLQLLGVLDRYPTPEFAASCAIVVAVAAVWAANAWRRRRPRGPLELLLRKFSGG